MYKEHLKCWLWRWTSLLWAENKFNCGTNRFKKGREDVNDDACAGRPSTSTTDKNIEAVKKITLDNIWIIIRMVADDVGISFGLC